MGDNNPDEPQASGTGAANYDKTAFQNDKKSMISNLLRVGLRHKCNITTFIHREHDNHMFIYNTGGSYKNAMSKIMELDKIRKTDWTNEHFSKQKKNELRLKLKAQSMARAKKLSEKRAEIAKKKEKQAKDAKTRPIVIFVSKPSTAAVAKRSDLDENQDLASNQISDVQTEDNNLITLQPVQVPVSENGSSSNNFIT